MMHCLFRNNLKERENSCSRSYRNNSLRNKNGVEQDQAFAVISHSITQLDLSNNGLGKKSADKLVKILTKIPTAVTFINLSGNAIFIGKSPQKRDMLLDKLQSINTHGRLGLENNGERTLIRAASLLIGMKRHGIFNQINMPLEVINEFAYWLGAPNNCFFKENSLRKFTERFVEAQDDKIEVSSFDFLAPPKS